MSHMPSSASPTSASSILAQLVNAETSAVAICTPVYVAAAGTFNRALGAGGAPAKVVGVAIDVSIPVGAVGNVLVDGVVNAATAQWDAICGTSGGLAADATYYLSTTAPGTLTTSSASGVPVVYGLSPTLGLLVIGQGGGSGGVGPGAVNAIAKFATSSTVGSSSITDNGTQVVFGGGGSVIVTPATGAVAIGGTLSTAGLTTATGGINASAGPTTIGLEQGAVITPAAVDSGGQVANFDPPGNATARVITIGCAAQVDLTGLVPHNVAGVPRIVTIYNGGPSNLVLYHENAGSTAQYRFHTADGDALTLAKDQSVDLIYDPYALGTTAARWYPLSTGYINAATINVLNQLGAQTLIATNVTTTNLVVGGAGGPAIRTGTGSPNSAVIGNPGDLYLNKSGGAATTLWVKESGTGTNTGWVGK